MNPNNNSATWPEHVAEYRKHSYEVCGMTFFFCRYSRTLKT